MKSSRTAGRICCVLSVHPWGSSYHIRLGDGSAIRSSDSCEACAHCRLGSSTCGGQLRLCKQQLSACFSESRMVIPAALKDRRIQYKQDSPAHLQSTASKSGQHPCTSSCPDQCTTESNDLSAMPKHTWKGTCRGHLSSCQPCVAGGAQR